MRAAADDAHAAGLPLVVEPVIYRLRDEGEDALGAAYPELVVAAVGRIRDLGVDLLKLPFPVVDLASSGAEAALAACRRVDDACAGTPWVLLGGGVDTDTFAAQVRIAGTAGASGFLVGRGIWGSALGRDPDAVARAAAGRSRDDLLRCRDIASRFARPLPGAA